jgi:hypothetical protein
MSFAGNVSEVWSNSCRGSCFFSISEAVLELPCYNDIVGILTCLFWIQTKKLIKLFHHGYEK